MEQDTRSSPANTHNLNQREKDHSPSALDTPLCVGISARVNIHTCAYCTRRRGRAEKAYVAC